MSSFSDKSPRLCNRLVSTLYDGHSRSAHCIAGFADSRLGDTDLGSRQGDAAAGRFAALLINSLTSCGEVLALACRVVNRAREGGSFIGARLFFQSGANHSHDGVIFDPFVQAVIFRSASTEFTVELKTRIW